MFQWNDWTFKNEDDSYFLVGIFLLLSGRLLVKICCLNVKYPEANSLTFKWYASWSWASENAAPDKSSEVGKDFDMVIISLRILSVMLDPWRTASFTWSQLMVSRFIKWKASMGWLMEDGLFNSSKYLRDRVRHSLIWKTLIIINIHINNVLYSWMASVCFLMESR